jgi:apolipoprotein N-acyltransferase
MAVGATRRARTASSRSRTFVHALTNVRDGLSHICLALGLVLFAVGSVAHTIPLAAWLYPVFFLRFVRLQRFWPGILLVLLATALVLGIEVPAVAPIPGALYFPVVLGYAVLFTVPYLIDGVISRRLHGLLATLVFPSAMTTAWYLTALVNPFGTHGNPAYTQYGDLPLLQLLSVTGVWGVLFVMGWFASMVNWAWEAGFAWPKVRSGAGLYASLLAMVLLFGGARMALFPVDANTVRIVGISPSHTVIAAADQRLSSLPSKYWEALYTGKASPAERAAYGEAVVPLFDELLSRSLEEGRSGAKIIVWPEAAGDAAVLQEDEAALLARAGDVTRATGAYLDMGVGVLLQQPVGSSFALDTSILVDPSGNVVWRYNKAHPLPGEPEPPGDGRVPTVQTPYGVMAGVICTDADSPSTLRQAGQAGADIMLVPSNDIRGADPYITQLTSFRAIENGYSLVRQARSGLAITVDYQGNVLAASDYFTTDPQVMAADVPIRGTRTIYAAVGDLFAWLCLTGLVVLIGISFVRRPKSSELDPTTS